jgi:hypothetical protein
MVTTVWVGTTDHTANVIIYTFKPNTLTNKARNTVSNNSSLTLCSRVVKLIKYPLMPEQFKFFKFSTPKCTVTYILTL